MQVTDSSSRTPIGRAYDWLAMGAGLVAHDLMLGSTGENLLTQFFLRAAGFGSALSGGQLWLKHHFGEGSD